LCDNPLTIDGERSPGGVTAGEDSSIGMAWWLKFSSSQFSGSLTKSLNDNDCLVRTHIRT